MRKKILTVLLSGILTAGLLLAPALPVSAEDPLGSLTVTAPTEAPANPGTVLHYTFSVKNEPSAKAAIYTAISVYDISVSGPQFINVKLVFDNNINLALAGDTVTGYFEFPLTEDMCKNEALKVTVCLSGRFEDDMTSFHG